MNLPELKELSAYGAILIAIIYIARLVIPWLLKQVEDSQRYIREMIDENREASKEHLAALRSLVDEQRGMRGETRAGFDQMLSTHNRGVDEIKKALEAMNGK